MAYWGHEPRRGRPEWAYFALFLLVLLTALAIVGTVEERSLDPVTGCGYGEILTSDGVCR